MLKNKLMTGLEMNERIKELAKQADKGYTGDSRDDLDLGTSLVGNDAIEKFAELLLKDVLAIVKDNTPNPDPYSRYGMQEAAERTANYIRDEIKYHFGLEK